MGGVTLFLLYIPAFRETECASRDCILQMRPMSSTSHRPGRPTSAIGSPTSARPHTAPGVRSGRASNRVYNLTEERAQYRVPRSHCLRKHCSRTVRVDPVGRTDTTRSLPGSGLPDTRLHRGLVHGYVQLFRCAKFIRPARFGWASFAGIETLR